MERNKSHTNHISCMHINFHSKSLCSHLRASTQYAFANASGSMYLYRTKFIFPLIQSLQHYGLLLMHDRFQNLREYHDGGILANRVLRDLLVSIHLVYTDEEISEKISDARVCLLDSSFKSFTRDFWAHQLLSGLVGKFCHVCPECPAVHIRWCKV